MVLAGLMSRIPQKDRNKVVALAVLALVLVVSLVWSMTGKSAAPPPVKKDKNRVPAKALSQGEDPKDEASELALAQVHPLDLASITPAGSLAISRNPFAYPPPPPPPRVKPPDPPPPPTIPIGNLAPSSVVAGIPRGVTVVVSGSQFPRDSQVFWNGRPIRTEYLSETQLRVSLSSADISNPGTVQVEVKSSSQPKHLWSAQLPFSVVPAPTPPFKYVGRIGVQALLDFGTERDGRKLVKVGDVVGVPAQWKILSVGHESIEVLDTRNEIKRTVTIAKKS